jgi:hypothetical protein
VKLGAATIAAVIAPLTASTGSFATGRRWAAAHDPETTAP